jgi:2-(1,2-epoxy-1,2-dihydrophenyl)acetyl-CoA isomerase
MTEAPARSIRLGIEGAVATITLDRPAALNALTIPMKYELLEALEAVRDDAAVRAVVLTGAGRAFCAGQDLKERLEPAAPSLGEELRERYNPIVRAMRSLPKPIVGAINGVAAGAGMSLALACDLRVAADGASFVLAFGKLGLIPDSGATWLLPRLVGPALAAELALLNQPLPSGRALELGLVTKVVSADFVLADAQAMAAELAAGAPIGIALTKQALNEAWDRNLDDALEAEAAWQDHAGATEDHAEGLAAFVGKQPPAFRGR